MAKKTLGRILAVQSVLIAAVPFLVLMVVGAIWALPKIEREVDGRQGILALTVAKETESFLQTPLVSASTFSLMEHAYRGDEHMLHSALDASVRACPSLKSLYIVDAEGVVRAASVLAGKEEHRRDIEGSDLSKAGFIVEAIKRREYIWSDTFLSVIGEGLSVGFAMPSKDDILVGEIELSSLTRFLKSLPAEEDQLILIIDAKGQVIADNNGIYTAQQLNIGNIPLLGRAAEANRYINGRFDFNGREMIGDLTTVPGIGWRVLVAMPVEAAHRPLWSAVRLAALGILIATLVAVFNALHLARRLASRFKKIEDHASLVANGVLITTWPKFSILEFNRLSSYLEKMANSMIRKDEELVSIFKTVGDSLFLLAVVGGRYRYDSVNPAFEKATGLSADEVKGKYIDEVLVPSDLVLMDRMLGEAAGEKRTVSWEQVTTYKNSGKVLTGIFSASPLLNSDGDCTHLVGTTKDIAERKKAEAAALKNESRLRLLVNILQYSAESSQDILDYSLEQAIQLTDSKIGYIYHYEEENKRFILNSWSKEVMTECAVVDPLTCYELDKTGLWGETVRQRRPIVLNDYARENPLKKGYPEGHVALSRFMTIPIFRQEKIIGVVGLANKETDYDETDVLQTSLLMESVWRILDRMRDEDEKKALQGQLLQAQKMDSIGRLAGGVAHDFNNMLGVILGHAEIAMAGVDPSSNIHEDLREITNAANRSAGLTRQLLAFARKETISPVVLDLNSSIEGILKMLRRIIGEDVNLTWIPKHGLWPVLIDPSQLDQILANLCVNARDAIAGLGRITIETGNCTLDETDCPANAECEPGDFVVLSVSDDGCGMDEATQANLFEPFFTTKGLGRGTGLGLATVYGIVKQNGGVINVYSEPGMGSSFKIYLPRHMGAVKPAKDPDAEIKVKGGNETILLVEDEAAIKKMAITMLEMLGYRVLSAGSPLEALRLVGETDIPINLLITDVIMPEMTGNELAKSISAMYPAIRVLFMSGYTANVIARQGILEEGVNFIQKPFSFNEFAGKIRNVLDQQ